MTLSKERVYVHQATRRTCGSGCGPNVQAGIPDMIHRFKPRCTSVGFYVSTLQGLLHRSAAAAGIGVTIPDARQPRGRERVRKPGGSDERRDIPRSTWVKGLYIAVLPSHPVVPCGWHIAQGCSLCTPSLACLC